MLLLETDDVSLKVQIFQKENFTLCKKKEKEKKTKLLYFATYQETSITLIGVDAHSLLS